MRGRPLPKSQASNYLKLASCLLPRCGLHVENLKMTGSRACGDETSPLNTKSSGFRQQKKRKKKLCMQRNRSAQSVLRRSSSSHTPSLIEFYWLQVVQICNVTQKNLKGVPRKRLQNERQWLRLAANQPCPRAAPPSHNQPAHNCERPCSVHCVCTEQVSRSGIMIYRITP